MSEELNLLNRLSGKAETIVVLQTLVQTLKEYHNNDNAKALFLTSIGQIEADIKNVRFTKNIDINLDVLKEDPQNFDFSEFIHSVRLKNIDSIKENNEGLKIMDNWATVSLENVQIKPLANPNAKWHYDRLDLFVDQIIGFTMIDANKSKQVTE